MTTSAHHLKLGEGDGDGDSISEKGLNNAASVWESVRQDHHFMFTHIKPILNSYKCVNYLKHSFFEMSLEGQIDSVLVYSHTTEL